ncbi:D-glycero-alpha-D-manno-heptose 7-phosphate kinase [subsurface metagenome]
MIVTRAPLRIPLGGGGTDFPSYYLKYGGYILGFAIDKYVYVVFHDTIDGKIRLKYSKNEIVEDVDKLENRTAAEALKAYGVTKGVEIATFSDVSESSGLGGSSAFCVALVVALRYKLGLSLDKQEIYQSAYDIERIKAKQPGGIQDQIFASLGGTWSITLGDLSL